MMMSFEIKIFELFYLKPNQTVFAGLVLGHNSRLKKCKAQLLIDDKNYKNVDIEGELIMARKHPKGHRAIFTRDKIDLTSEFIKMHNCRLKQI